jgi:hypothetical protein
MPKGIKKYGRGSTLGVLFNAEGDGGGGTPPADTKPADASATDDGKPEDLGDNGKKALDAERRAKRDAEKRATELEARLKELEDRDKTEAERQADKVAKAEALVTQLTAKVAEALKSHLVSLHQIGDDDAELFLTATDPELLLKQVTRLMETKAQAAEAAGRPRPPRPDQNQGAGTPTVPTDPRAADIAQIEADIAAAKRR